MEASDGAVRDMGVPQYSSKRVLMNGILFSNSFAWAEGTVTAILALSSVLVDKDLYAKSGRLLYIGFCVGTLFGPWVVGRLGLKRTLVIGLIGFSFYSASFVYPTAVVMQVAAATSGLFGSWLWTAQGVYFTSNAALHSEAKLYEAKASGVLIDGKIQFKHSIGLMSGIFAGIFPFAMASCKLIASVILEIDENKGVTFIYIMYTFIALASTVGMSCVLSLKPYKRKKNSEYVLFTPTEASLAPPNGSTRDVANNEETGKDDMTCSTLLQDILVMLRLSVRPLMLLMCPTNIAFGFVAGYFPLIVTPMVTDHHGADLAGYLYALSGGAAFLLAFTYGYISNRLYYGRLLVMLWGAASFATIFFILWKVEVTSAWAYAGLFVLYGSGTTVWQGTCMAVFADYWHDQAAPAFALLKLQSGAATAVAYFVFPNMSLTSSELALRLLFVVGLGAATYVITVVWREYEKQPGCRKRYGRLCCCARFGDIPDDVSVAESTHSRDIPPEESESLLVLKSSFTHNSFPQ